MSGSHTAGMKRAKRNACRSGHAMTKANTGWNAANQRTYCKACAYQNQLKWKEIYRTTSGSGRTCAVCDRALTLRQDELGVRFCSVGCFAEDRRRRPCKKCGGQRKRSKGGFAWCQSCKAKTYQARTKFIERSYWRRKSFERHFTPVADIIDAVGRRCNVMAREDVRRILSLAFGIYFQWLQHNYVKVKGDKREYKRVRKQPQFTQRRCHS